MDQKAAARLTRKQKRVMQQGNFKEPSFKLTFRLKDVQPLTDNQRLTFDYYDTGKNLLLHGIAGTGKSFLSIYLSLRSILSDQCRYKKLVIVRSVVPTRDMGFLPGNNKEKAKVYEAPYQAIFNELFDRGDAYEFLKNKNLNDAIQLIYSIYDKGYSVMDILDNYFLFIKTTSILTEDEKYIITPFICKYITIFYNIHEDEIELALFTNNLIEHFT